MKRRKKTKKRGRTEGGREKTKPLFTFLKKFVYWF